MNELKFVDRGPEFLPVQPFGPSRGELLRQLEVARGWTAFWVICAAGGWVSFWVVVLW